MNYKDALAAIGRRAVAGPLPHVPGIDAAGTVVESRVEHIQPGQPVLVTGYELGAPRWGGWSELIRVPAEWVVPCPAGLTLRDAMILGTAGFTAAQCLLALQRQEITPDRGPVVVTGATGGVGSIAICLLAARGYEVIASSGKRDHWDWLRSLGARDVVSREEVQDDSPRPMLSSRWAAAVDTVGGRTLSTLLRSVAHRGCVAACGLVGGVELSLTVFPFLLRGVRLEGIDSAKCPMSERLKIWDRLAGEWRCNKLETLAHEIALDDVGNGVEQILKGNVRGRILVRVLAE